MLVSRQVTLGAFVIWSSMDPVINTAHVVNGALVLGTSLVLTLRSFAGSTVLGFYGSTVRGSTVRGSTVRGSQVHGEVRP
jgi:hypothetical protein